MDAMNPADDALAIPLAARAWENKSSLRECGVIQFASPCYFSRVFFSSHEGC